MASAWDDLLAKLEPHVTPEWTRYARDHGAQEWIRLILLVDAHHQLSSPRVAEKVAMTMADLAEEHAQERAGWEAIRERANEGRLHLVEDLQNSAESVLSDNLMALFVRSIEPRAPMM